MVIGTARNYNSGMRPDYDRFRIYEVKKSCQKFRKGAVRTTAMTAHTFIYAARMQWG